MDPVRNPFAPGAGSQPPELTGRDSIVADADIALKRVLFGRHEKSQILLGLRGVGKTVLLNRIDELAAEAGHITAYIEAPEDRTLAELLYPKLHQALRRLALDERAKAAAHNALGALRAFAAAFKVKVGDVSIEVDPAPGTADSGNLEYDLADLFIRIGEAAKRAEKGWTLLIDELQYLSAEEWSAVIVAIHRVNQKSLPVMFFGAGLPQLTAISGNAKSYAERLFAYVSIGPLGREAAAAAIVEPLTEEGETIADDALSRILDETKGYPYFLQEWGYQAWNAAQASPISLADVEAATRAAVARLDDGFFRVRFDRLTPKEREYVFAMAALGPGPYRTADIAGALGEAQQKLGPRRAKIISKGMIFSPAYGDVDFTVPMFDDYLRRLKAGDPRREPS